MVITNFEVIIINNANDASATLSPLTAVDTTFLSEIFCNIFPGPHAYWTGYYTSRPSYKFHERQSNGLLQAAKQINAIMGSGRKAEVMELQNAVPVTASWCCERGGSLHLPPLSQHHDAVTGTAKEAVDADYHLRLR